MFWTYNLVLSLATLTSGHMTITLSTSGSYVISVNNASWLTSGPTYFRADNCTYSTADGTLKQVNLPVSANGTDLLGSYQKVVYTWNAGQQTVQTAVTHYRDVEALVFSQIFVSGMKDTSTCDMNLVISGFPTFKTGSQDDRIGWMTYSGLFIGWMKLRYGRWDSKATFPGGIESGPVVLFDEKDNVIIISPFSQFMAASYVQNSKMNTLDWGIMGDVDKLPSGYQYDTIIYHSNNGINKAMEEWGHLLRKWYGRSTSAKEMDTSVNYIGYYTDNGAYYYHFKEQNKTYQETIKVLVDYVHRMNIPYRYLQLDDWWYPVKGPGYGATITWTADPSVFPNGLQYIYNMTQWPVVGHNRYWSSITPYAKQNGGKFNFIIDGQLSLPDDQTFWDYLLAGAKQWGLVVYEQDWLNYHVEKFGPLHKDVALGRRWLYQMGEAAKRFDMQLQYCMALPRHLLASVEVPAVSQVRASIDYHLKKNQWTIGVTSIFAHAMGVAPFKDNLWTKSVQPGNVYNKTEPNPLLQVTVAVLSTGPVGIGDKVGYTDVKLVNRLINEDGLLLKPSKPATAIDKQILELAFGDKVGPDGEVWSTYSDISGIKFGIIFCPLITNSYYIRPKDIGIPDVQYAVYSYAFNAMDDQPKPFDSKHPLLLRNCTTDNICMYYASPVITVRSKPLIVLGELSKLVPMSPNRVKSLSYSTYDVTLVIQGRPGEQVDFHFIYAGLSKTIHCKITDLGKAMISWTKQACY